MNTTAARSPSIKGAVFREFVRWYGATRGAAACLRAYAALPDELKVHLDPNRDGFGILAGSWLRADVAAGLLEQITRDLSPDERTALLRDGVEHTLSTVLTGLYRVIFQTLVTPERHAKYAQKIWSHFYDCGTVSAQMLEAKRSEQIVTSWAGHHPILCDLSVWSLTAFHSHMGCKNVKVTRTSCVRSSGARRPMAPASEGCRFVIAWE